MAQLLPEYSPSAPSAVDCHVGAQIAARRTIVAMARETFASKLHLPVGVITAFECGMVRVRASTLYDISLILDVPVAYFFEGYGLDAANDHSQPTPPSKTADN